VTIIKEDSRFTILPVSNLGNLGMKI